MKSPCHFRVLIAPALMPLLLSSAALAQITTTVPLPPAPLPDGVVTLAGDMVNNVLVPRTGNSITVGPTPPPLNLGGFDIVINAGPTLAGNAAALAAFNRAAQAWEARISDPITITIDANLGALGAGIIGSASSVVLNASYNGIRGRMVADGADEADDTITASLPTSAQFTATVPGGTTLNTNNLLASKANLKALGGFGDLDGAFGPTDATITFSTNFSFDFDNSNGVGGGLLDFETVAAHEIGHALGFSSFVDSVNAGATDVRLLTLDLFRFANNTGADPSTAGEFTTFARNLVPGTAAITDQITGATSEWGMSTGLVTGFFSGTDGLQASHWKADELTANFIGLMDPTLANGQFYGPQESDFRALDLIGYEIAPIPEVSTAGFGICVALAGMLARRRRGSRMHC